MADVSQEILDLNKRVATAREKQIRLQTKRETLQTTRKNLIDEIREAGYDPDTLPEAREQLERDLNDKKQALETQLETAEKQLDSIPE